MINVRFGYDEDCIRDIDLYFNNVYEKEWLEDGFVKQMILDVDRSKVVSSQCIESPVLGQIPPERLSGGVKALICMLKTNAYIDLIVCGPNCATWICEIAKKKDICVGMSGYDLTFEGCKLKGTCLNDDSQITGYKDWILKMTEWVGA